MSIHKIFTAVSAFLCCFLETTASVSNSFFSSHIEIDSLSCIDIFSGTPPPIFPPSSSNIEEIDEAIAPLDYHKRPADVRDLIKERYDDVVAKEGHWLYKGCKHYNLCTLNFPEIIKNLLNDKTRISNEVYIMDIGGGDFQWGYNIADFINAQSDIESDRILHIFNLRGEGEVPVAEERLAGIKDEETIGRCIIHNITNCQIEYLAMHPRIAPYIGKMDLIVSRMCFVHLVDAPGTLLQAYDLLNIGGIIATDGFYFLYDSDISTKSFLRMDVSPYLDAMTSYNRLLSILSYTGCPFILEMMGSVNLEAPGRFVLKKIDMAPLKLPLEYVQPHAVVKIKRINGRVFCKSLTEFKASSKLFEIEQAYSKDCLICDEQAEIMKIYGRCKEFLEELRAKKLLTQSDHNSYWDDALKTGTIIPEKDGIFSINVTQ